MLFDGDYDLFVAIVGLIPPFKINDHDTWERDPVPSPDGDTVLYTQVGDVWLVDLATKAETELTNDNRSDHSAEWSPSGGSIVYVKTTVNGDQVWAMDADGGNQRQVSPDNGWMPDW